MRVLEAFIRSDVYRSQDEVSILDINLTIPLVMMSPMNINISISVIRILMFIHLQRFGETNIPERGNSRVFFYFWNEYLSKEC